MVNSFVFAAKVFAIIFFGIVFAGNLIELLGKGRNKQINAELYFEKQMWMLISLLAIAIILGNF